LLYIGALLQGFSVKQPASASWFYEDPTTTRVKSLISVIAINGLRTTSGFSARGPRDKPRHGHKLRDHWPPNTPCVFPMEFQVFMLSWPRFWGW